VVDVQRNVTADLYENKYKGIGLSLAMLSRALNGSYVNFGVFELYNDPALSDALEYAMKMALSIPPEEVICCPLLNSLMILRLRCLALLQQSPLPHTYTQTLLLLVL
jgi:exportin-7